MNKQEKQKLMKELEHIDKTGKFESFDDYIFKSHQKLLSELAKK